MSIRGRIASLLLRIAGSGSEGDAGLPSSGRSILVDDRQPPVLPLGDVPQIRPWSLSRVARILRNFEQMPSPQTLAEARLARHCLCRFWLSAPVDQLEILYGTPLGRCYRFMLGTELARHRLLREENEWRRELSRQLVDLFDHPERNNVLLALMPYYRLGQFRINDPLKAVPRWLLPDYASLFEPALLPRLRVRPALPPASLSSQRTASSTARPRPRRRQRGVMQVPRLTALSGQQARELAGNEEFLSRGKGLVNLYQIDRSDAEIRKELAGMRLQVGQIWLTTATEGVERLFRSSFGDLYRSLLSCGFGAEELDPAEVTLRDQLARCVTNMNRPGALQALLAALLFYAPGKIRFQGEASRRQVPEWLLTLIDQGSSETATENATP